MYIKEFTFKVTDKDLFFTKIQLNDYIFYS